MSYTNQKWEHSIFNRDFFPTPVDVLQMMQLNIAGETILEPQSGSGNIIKYCLGHGVKEILFCEINPDLAEMCKSKARFIKHDFLKVTREEVSHVTQIIMNPPFSNGHKHILHAWEIAPEGCEITSLFNYQSIDVFSELKHIIKTYGFYTQLGDCFSTAERKTNVEIACIKLFKPVETSNENFDGFYMDAEPETLNENGIMRYNEIQALVNNYIAAVKLFDSFDIINDKIKSCCRPVGMGAGFSYTTAYNEAVVSKSDFSKALQKASWKHIFKIMNLEKYLTKGVIETVNKFVEQQTKIPFTVKNVHRMFDIIVGTRVENLNKALVEAVDRLTRHTHDNRFGVEGWKTNEGHLLNKKFIIDYICELNWSSGIGIKTYGSNFETIRDLVKVICYVTGTDYDTIISIEYASVPVDDNGDYKRCGTYKNEVVNRNRFEPNTWYSWGFFDIKVFKKGTCHFKFKNEKHWEQINRAYAKIKGQVLPEKI